MRSRQEGRAFRRRPILGSIWSTDPRWVDTVDVIDRREQRWLSFVLTFAWTARRYPTVVLLGSVGRRDLYQDLVIAVLVRRVTAPGTRIVLTDCTWSPGSAALSGGRAGLHQVLALLHRLLVRAIDGPRTTFCVLTAAEQRSFPDHWGVARDRVVCTPFSHTLYEHEDVVPARGDYVFAGGDSMRDYDLLMSACRGLDAQVLVASRQQIVDPPSNVTVRAMSHDDYVRALLGAGVVAVPLRDDGWRSAGQQTYLNAMLLGKPVVVTDALGVTEVVSDAVDGFIVPSDPDCLRAALARCIATDHSEEIDRIGRTARDRVLGNYMPGHYLHRVLDVALPPGDMPPS